MSCPGGPFKHELWTLYGTWSVCLRVCVRSRSSLVSYTFITTQLTITNWNPRWWHLVRSFARGWAKEEAWLRYYNAHAHAADIKYACSDGATFTSCVSAASWGCKWQYCWFYHLFLLIQVSQSKQVDNFSPLLDVISLNYSPNYFRAVAIIGMCHTNLSVTRISIIICCNRE